MNSQTYGNTRFHFYAGLAGEISVDVSPTKVEMVPGVGGTVVARVRVWGGDVVALVLDTLRTEMISRLEAAEVDDLRDPFSATCLAGSLALLSAAPLGPARYRR